MTDEERKAKKRQYMRDRYAADKDGYIAKRKAWRKANQDKERIFKAAWKRANKDKIRDTNMRLLYGLTLVQYEAILKAQDGRCAICGTLRSGGIGRHLHIDHDHVTGKVRGLLCNACNKGIGFLGDSPAGLWAAEQYLLKHMY